MVDVEVDGNEGVPLNPRADRPGTNHLKAQRALDILRRVLYLVISLYGLHLYQFYKTIFVSPKVRHEWFKLGLAATIGILGIKAYVEIYEGKINKKTVNYKNYRNITHAVMILIMFSTVAFNVALWPHYGWNSPLILGICFFGVILQFVLLVPTWVQNAVGFVGLTFFIQQYS